MAAEAIAPGRLSLLGAWSVNCLIGNHAFTVRSAQIWHAKPVVLVRCTEAYIALR
jgi:hypothetical protein